MLETLDYLVLGGYFLLIGLIAYWAQNRDQSTKEYFLGGRNIPWVLAGLSIVATEASALTFIGAPVQSLKGDWTYIQLALGSIIGKIVVSFVLIPAYYRADVDSVYAYLGRRFGLMTQHAASILFFIGRSLGSGVRLFGAAIALVVVVNIDFGLAIALIASVAVIYTGIGGIRSVIYTDSLQGFLLVGGGLAALIHLWMELDLSPFEFYGSLADAKDSVDAPKMRILDLDLDLGSSKTIWAGLFGVTFLTMATHGTDQDMVQRVLTCSDQNKGRKSMWFSAALNIPIVFLFLSIGSALWMYWGGDEGTARVAGEIAQGMGEEKARYDYVFPYYVMQIMPAGIKGFIVAAIFAASMSSLDSAISSLATTAVTCWWRPIFRPGKPDKYYRNAGRVFTVLFGIILVGIAIWAWKSESSGGANQGFGVLILGLKVLTWIFPPLLGIFLLGVLTKRGSDVGNLIALFIGIGTLLVVAFWEDIFGGTPPFSWAWNSPIACILCFGIAALFPADQNRKPMEAVN